MVMNVFDYFYDRTAMVMDGLHLVYDSTAMTSVRVKVSGSKYVILDS